MKHQADVAGWGTVVALTLAGVFPALLVVGRNCCSDDARAVGGDMETVRFPVTGDDLDAVITLLEDEQAESAYSEAWVALRTAKARLAETCATSDEIRVSTSAAHNFLVWCETRAAEIRSSTATQQRARAASFARVATALKLAGAS